jgi:hypothetical protein
MGAFREERSVHRNTLMVLAAALGAVFLSAMLLSVIVDRGHDLRTSQQLNADLEHEIESLRTKLANKADLQDVATKSELTDSVNELRASGSQTNVKLGTTAGDLTQFKKDVGVCVRAIVVSLPQGPHSADSEGHGSPGTTGSVDTGPRKLTAKAEQQLIVHPQLKSDCRAFLP